ncbi:MAG: hypothetical protein AAF221_00500 [Pseudomonadota bacterium]
MTLMLMGALSIVVVVIVYKSTLEEREAAEEAKRLENQKQLNQRRS